MNLIDWIGSTGVFLILLAYLLLILHKLTRDSYIYLIMNAVGAGLACLASILLNYWPFIILEAAWTLVSVLAIINLRLKPGVK
ncbi:MAG: CBU_0592 family membrane protein [Bacteroidales bacterium]